MTIHHATVKRAAAQGFLIADSTENEDAFRLTPQTTKTEAGYDAAVAKAFGAEWAIEGDDAKALVDAIPHLRMLVIEHGIDVSQPDDFDLLLSVSIDGEDMALVEPNVAVADLDEEVVAEAAASAASLGYELADEEEEDNRASVVPHTYKKRYADAGHPNHCGDWLAAQLNGECLGDDGFNLDVFQSICEANGVDLAPYLRRKTRGWQGRARMTGRNKLTTAIVQANGVLILPASATGDDREVQAPADWLASKAPKAKGKAAVEA